MNLFDKVLQDSGTQETRNLFDAPAIDKPVEAKPMGLFSGVVADKQEEDEELLAVHATKNSNSNTAIQDAALRFAKDRFGMDNITPEEAVEEYIEHFRSFNVNELTAGGDYNYVSAAAADATERGDEKAAQRLSDYRLLYQSFNELPAFSDGVLTATGDYIAGLATAPSTYVGLALPGVGKASGVAATTAAKVGIRQILKNAFTKPISSLANQAAARPLPTMIGVEGVAGSLQNIAAQKTEIAADLRDEFSYAEAAATGAISGIAAPAAFLPSAIKTGVGKFAERKTGDLIGEASEAVAKKNEEALKSVAKVLEDNSELAAEIKAALPSIDPANLVGDTKLRKLDPEQVEAGREVAKETQEELNLLDSQRIAITPEAVSRIFGAVTEIMVKAGVTPRKGERISEAVSRVIRDADLGEKVAPDIMEKYNITSDDLANLMMADAADTAGSLGERGAAAKVFKNLQKIAGDDIFNLSPERRKVIDDLAEAAEKGAEREALTKIVDNAEKGGLFRSLDAVRLASMTSQTATTIRNTVSGVSRVGIDVLMKSFDRGVASAAAKIKGETGKVGLGTAVPNDDIGAIVFGIMNKKETEAVTEIFNLGFSEKHRQLIRQMRDVDDSLKGKKNKFERMANYSKELNTLNTLSDNIFKRASFVGSLKRQLNELYARKSVEFDVKLEEYDLIQIIKEGRFNDVFGGKEGNKMLDTAVNDALEFTYQRTPDGPFAKALINGIHKYPFLTTSLVPFPRFVANAMKFTYEYSPLYLLGKNKQGNSVLTELVGKGNEENYEATAKALTGVALYSAAYAFRASEHAGENWYEYKFEDGSTFDMRPFFPAAPFLFIADMAYRSHNEDPLVGDRSFVTDSIQALTGTQFRAGFGIYALDSALKDLSSDDIDASEKFKKIGGNFIANVVSTFTIPMTAAQDVYNTFLAPDYERIVRQTDVSDDITRLIAYKSLARVPGNYWIQKQLAETIGMPASEIYEMPTRDAPLRRVTPITRQTFGILRQERRNYFEDELARLKINRKILTSKTGVPEADQLIGQLIGEYVSDFVVPVMKNSEQYKNYEPEMQKEFIRTTIQEYKKDIMDNVKGLSRTAGKDRYGYDPLERVAFNKVGKVYQQKAIARYHELYGKPTEDNPYDYEELTRLGKAYQKLGVNIFE